MTFDANVTTMQKVTLKVTDMKFGPKDTVEKQKHIRQLLGKYACWD